MKRSDKVANTVHIAAKASFGTGLVLLLIAIIAPFTLGAAIIGDAPTMNDHVVWSEASEAGVQVEMLESRHYAIMANLDRTLSSSVEVSVQGDAVFDEFVRCANASSRVGCYSPEGWVTLGTVDLPTSCPCTIEVTGASNTGVRLIDLSSYDAALIEQQAGFSIVILTGCGFLVASLAALAAGFLIWAIVDDETSVQTISEGVLMGAAPSAPVPIAEPIQPSRASAAIVGATTGIAVQQQVIAPSVSATAHAASQHGSGMVSATPSTQGNPGQMVTEAADEKMKSRGSAAPNPAREYHDSLIAQGYDSDIAAQHTRLHFPGFEP